MTRRPSPPFFRGMFWLIVGAAICYGIGYLIYVAVFR